MKKYWRVCLEVLGPNGPVVVESDTSYRTKKAAEAACDRLAHEVFVNVDGDGGVAVILRGGISSFESVKA